MAQQSRKAFTIDTMLSKSYWIWRASPALSVPTMLSTSLSVLAQAIFGVAILGLIVELENTSIMTHMAQALGAGDYSSLETSLASPQFLGAALAFLLPAVIVTVVVSILASGFVYSAEFGSYWEALKGSHVGVAEVMVKFRERWKPMAWTFFLSYLVTFAPLMLAALVASLMILASSGPATVLASIVLLGAAAAGTLVLSSLLIYTPVAVMGDRISGRAAIVRSIQVSRRNYGMSLTYCLVYFFFTAALTGASSLVPGASLPLSSLATVGVLILVTPVLHLTKTSVYREVGRPDPLPFEFLPSFVSDVGPLLRSLWSSFLVGLRELKAYALDLQNLPYHCLSALSMVLGWFVGVHVVQTGLVQLVEGLGYSAGQTNPLVSGSLPLSLGVYIFFHNWEVSLATALSGVWFSVAPFVTLFLNGVLVGAVSGLVPNTTMLLAAILPHGIIEIPSFVLAGSVGMKLGVAFLRSVRSEDPSATEEFHRVARKSVYIVVGLALLFFVAGIIEGNVTPVVMKMAGWS